MAIGLSFCLLVFSVIFMAALRSMTAINRTSDGRLYRVTKGVPMLVAGIYLLSAVSGLIADVQEWYPTFHFRQYEGWVLVIYTAVIALFILPVFSMRPIVSAPTVASLRPYKPLAKIMILLGIFSLIYQTPYALAAIEQGALTVRNTMNQEGVYLLPDSFLTTAAVAVSTFYPLYLLMLFAAILGKWGWPYKIGLSVAAASYLVSGVTFATRDVFVFFGLTALFYYFTFVNVLQAKTKKRAKLVFFTLFSVLLVGLVGFTVQRFSNDSSYLSFGTIGYIGSQPYVFEEAVYMHEDFYGGRLRFPLVTNIILGPSEPVSRTSGYETMFGTFVKDLYCEGGWLFVGLSCLVVPLAWLALRRTRKAPRLFLAHILLSLLYFQTISQGVFYYTLGSRSGNIYTFVMLLIIIGLIIDEKFKRKLSS